MESEGKETEEGSMNGVGVDEDRKRSMDIWVSRFNREVWLKTKYLGKFPTA